MRRSEIECYVLASEIEEICARSRIAAQRRRIPNTLAQEYDPLAATELGSLIFNRLQGHFR